MSLKATILVPTTGNRGALLRYSLGSILRQTVPEIEVFVIGDGVTDPVRQVMAELTRQDSRLRFFDHPKGVRRGETYRHAALAEARGEIVCYLCDRDLMMPHHVATMRALLADADFAHTFVVSILPGDRFVCTSRLDVGARSDRSVCCSNHPNSDRFAIPLSTAGHTLAMYRRLPFGWRTTPPEKFTDLHMWQQFFDQPDCRTVSGFEPTIVYLPRFPHHEWPDERRLADLVRWHERMQDPGWYEQYLREALAALARDRADQARSLRRYRARCRPIRSIARWTRFAFGRMSRAVFP